MNLKDKKVLLVGLAKTGLSTIKYLDKLGANIVVNDIKDKEKLQDLVMFYSSKHKRLVTLKEYVEEMKDGSIRWK